MFAVKFLDEEAGIIEGLGIPYGGPVRKSLAEPGKDIQGEYFSSKTDFTSPNYDGRVKSMPELYHHGLDPDVKDEPIGQVLESEDRPEGKWVKVQLDKASKYYAGIKELVKRGALLFSSGAEPSGVKKAEDGFIEKWPWKEMSLTPGAANPMQPMPSIKSLTEEALKALSEPQPPEGVDPAEWEMGMKEEREHDDVTGGDPAKVAQIVSAHLKEDPKYYTKLNAAMNKQEVKGMKNPTAPTAEQKPEVKKTIKCVCGKAVELPPEVIQALTALKESVETILGGQEAEAQPEGDKPANPSEPGVGQGMAPENHVEPKAVESAEPPAKEVTETTEEEKKENHAKAVKTMEAGIDARIAQAVEGATKSLRERVDFLEHQPARPAPAKTLNTENPHMTKENAIKARLDDIDLKLADPGIDVNEKIRLSRDKALLEIPELRNLA